MGTLTEMVTAGMRSRNEHPLIDATSPGSFPDLYTSSAPGGSWRNNPACYRLLGVSGLYGFNWPSNEFLIAGWVCLNGVVSNGALFGNWAHDPGPPDDFGVWRVCAGVDMDQAAHEVRVYADDTGPWVGAQNLVKVHTVSSMLLDGNLHRGMQWMHLGFYIDYGVNAKITMYLDGQQFFTWTSGANEWLTAGDMIQLAGRPLRTSSGWSGSSFYDNVYVLDVTGEGDQVPEALRALMTHVDGAGTTTQWTPKSSTNWSNVDDPNIPPDNDTTYVETATTGNLDLYTHDQLTALVDLPYSYVVNGEVLVQTVYKNVDDGEVTQIAFEHAVKVGASQSVDGTFSNTVLDTYDFAVSIFTQQPDASAWNLTDFNNAEFGYNSK